MRATFTCPLPPTLNEQIRLARANKFKSATTKKEWNTYIGKLAKEQNLPQFPNQVWMVYEWRLKNLERDPDNTSAGAKYVNDGLKHIGIIKEDNLKIILGFDHFFKKWYKDELILTISDKPIIKKIFIEDNDNDNATH